MGTSSCQTCHVGSPLSAFENPDGLDIGEEAWGQSLWRSNHKGQAVWSKNPGERPGYLSPGDLKPSWEQH